MPDSTPKQRRTSLFSPSVDSLRKYLDVRVDGYRKAVDDLDAIEPPE